MIHPLTATLADWLLASPLAFTIGFFAGLALSSRYRITRIDSDHKSGRRDERP